MKEKKKREWKIKMKRHEEEEYKKSAILREIEAK
jgi:hypothetical protein